MAKAKIKKKSSGRIETTMIRARQILTDDKKSSNPRKKKQPNKFLQIPSLKAIKKYVKKQAESSLISKKLKSLKKISKFTPTKKSQLKTVQKKTKKSSSVSFQLRKQPPKKKFVKDQSVLTETIQPTTLPRVFVDDERIPSSYNRTWLGLLVKDPHWIYATWEISQEALHPFRTELEDPGRGAKIVLRMYDVTCVQFDGHNANYFFDLEVGSANSWYVNLWKDHVVYCADIGVRTNDGKFSPLARSNCAETPRTGCSWRSEQIWMEVKDQTTETPYIVARIQPRGPASPLRNIKARRIYLTAEDIRRYYAQLMPFLKDIIAARLGKLFAKRVLQGSRFIILEDSKERQEIYALEYGTEFFHKFRLGASEEALLLGKGSQLGASEQSEQFGSSEKIQMAKQRKFFFEIWADVIVYGRTEADAKVLLGNQKINLRPDGTFTLRSALPDTTITLPFTAVSGDQLEKREITTVVNRQTQYFLPVILAGKIQ